MGGTLYRVPQKKTSIYLDPDLDFALAKQAEASGLTKAELIRRALRAAVENGGQARPTAFGVFEGSPELSERADEELADGFGE